MAVLRRLSDFVRRHVAPLALLAIIIVFGAYGTPGSAHKIAEETHQRCLESKANRDALRAIILRGRDVGRPGSPGYAYYRTHPDEARLARERVDRALADLPPIDC